MRQEIRQKKNPNKVYELIHTETKWKQCISNAGCLPAKPGRKKHWMWIGKLQIMGNMEPFKSSLLDHTLQHCQEKDAVFVEHHFEGLFRSVESTVETFHPGYTAAAKALADHTPAKPIGEGTQGETRVIHGVTLAWTGQTWGASGNFYQLEIGPECDESDVNSWLLEFKPMREKVLTRRVEGQSQKHLTFLVGKAANRIHNRCVAFANGQTVGCPITEKGHIIAVKTVQASHTQADLLPVKLHTILLHEVGHTLRQQFPGLRQALSSELTVNGAMAWDRVETLVRLVSPHYLAEQHQSTVLKFGAIQIKNFTEPTRPEKGDELKWCDRMAGEIFAETCRHFYLDAVLEGKSRPEIKTGCEPVDN